MTTATMPKVLKPSQISLQRSIVPVLSQLMQELDAGQSVSIDGLKWKDYEQITELRDQLRPKAKLTYDRGRLEIMVVSFFHDNTSRRLGQIVTTIAETLDIDFKSGGNTTFQRDDLDCGLQPDECFYIQNYETVRKLRKIDLAIHPAPDLAVEVDYTNSSVPKDSIYAKLGVPELWRLRGIQVQFLIRQSTGEYLESTHSRAFPQFASAVVSQLVISPDLDSEKDLIRAVRQMVNNLPK